MYSILTFLTVVGTLWTVDCGEIYSLTYIKTVLSKPVNLPGIYEFTAMGLLDDRMIDYYDSSRRQRIPMQPRVEEWMGKDYWERQTQINQANEEVAKVDLGTIRDRVRDNNDTDLHVYQWRNGCTAKKQAGDDKSLKFISGIFVHSYDGNDFLAFDHVNKQWIAPGDLGVPTKQKWDANKMIADSWQHYLETECVGYLSKYVDYLQEQLKTSKPPDLHVYRTKNKNPSSITLHCMATGFIFKGVTMNIMRDGRVVDQQDGLITTGVRPNGDGTYQIMNRVEILRSDSARFTCEVIHPASNMHKFEEWERDDEGPNIGVITGGVVAAVAVIVAVALAVFIYMKKKKERLDGSDSGSTGSSRVSGQGSSSGGSTQPQPECDTLLGRTKEAVPSTAAV